MRSNRKSVRRLWLSSRMESLEPREMLAGDLAAIDEPINDGGTGRIARIVGGHETKADWPWIVSLQDGIFGHSCGGTLVAPDVVVTAAHCVQYASLDSLDAVIGQNDLSKPFVESIPVSEAIIHPNYDSFSLDSDIAVLLLETASRQTPISIVNSQNLELANPDADATVLGWGQIENDTSPSVLHEVVVPVLSNEQANQPDWLDGQVTERMVAAGLARGVKDSCYGDSGGPMAVADGDGQFYLAGVVSWGESCGAAKSPGVYTRVSSFADWIAEVGFVSSKGTVGFTEERFYADSRIKLIASDADLAGDATLTVELRSSSGDVESIELTSSSTTGRFQHEVRFYEGEGESFNGRFEVSHGDRVEVIYLDADDGTGQSSAVSATATVVSDDHGNNLNSATPIEVNTSVAGEIELDDDTDWLRLELNAGAFYEIDVVLDGTLEDSYLELYDSEGNLLADNDDFGDGFQSKVSYIPSATGVYFAVVASYFGSGTYHVHVQEGELPPVRHVAIPSVTNGQIRNEPFDRFSFDVEQGKSYQANVELLQLSDSLLDLYDSSNVLLASDDDGGGGLASAIVYTASETGTHFVHVSSFDGINGSYRFRIEEIQNQVIDVPSKTEGDLVADRTDRYEFSAEAGAVYSLEVKLNTLEDSTIEVFGPDGQSVGFDDDGGVGFGSLLTFQATLPGDYVVVVGDYGFGGTYVLDLFEVKAKPPVTRFVDVPSVTNSTIREPFEVDRYAFEVVAGVDYVVTTALLRLNDSVLTLYDEQLDVLMVDDDGGPGLASHLEFTAAESGTYYIDVGGVQSATGSYLLNFAFGETEDHGDTPEAATPVTLAATEDGVIRTGDDVDWFSFRAAAGTAYKITATPTGLVDSKLSLFAPDGKIRLETNDDANGSLGSEIVWVAQTTGTYFVRMESLTDNDVGAYQFEVKIPYGDANLDGVFNSADLVKLFQRAEYEDSIPNNSDWQGGDWNGDGDFTTQDLVTAFMLGDYQRDVPVAATVDAGFRDSPGLQRNDRFNRNRHEVAAVLDDNVEE